MNSFWNHRFGFFILILFLAFPISLFAQFSMNGEFRPRAEVRNGYRTLQTSSTDPAFFISQRTRMNFLFNDEYYRFKLTAQDIRVWGDEVQLGDQSNVNIHEAWAQINIIQNLKAKIGRQELIYDDQRLLGSVNWTQPARSHDALIIKYQDDKSNINFDVGLAYNQEKENVLGNSYALDNYKTLSFAWLKKDFGYLDISGILVMDGFEDVSMNTNLRYTYGTNVNYMNKDWAASGTVYLQNGNDRIRDNISAYMFAGKTSYQLKSMKITAGIDYLSGGKNSDTDPMRHSFHTLYATNHKFYGNMDYFLNIPKETNGGGLTDLFLSSQYIRSNELIFNLTYHYIALANKISDPLIASTDLSKYLASEVDISMVYKFRKDIQIQCGYSTLFSSDSLERLLQRTSGGLQQWGWIMLVLKPDFFTSE